MDPRAVLQPVGPRPPYVYWVRRLVLLVVTAAVVVVVAQSCGGGSSRGAGLRPRADQQPLTSSSPAPSASAPPSGSAGGSPTGAVTACRSSALRVTVTSDATSYPSGVDPRFTAVVRNTGPACRFPTALASRSWRILSGVDQVWSTGDCPRSSAGKRVRMAAGQQITYVLPWDRFRSTPGCAVAGAAAQPGTYRLYVTIAGARAAPVVFHLGG